MNRSPKAFTWVDRLMVIAIIALLAILLLPASPHVGKAARKVKTRLEMEALVQAIEAYHNIYGTFPVSAATQHAGGTGDFTYGTSIQTPFTAMPIGTLVGGQVVANSEVIAILMDLTNYPGKPRRPTANSNHLLNRRQIIFLDPAMAEDSNSPGVGTDLVYRDPWGTPYFITLDLNNDGQCNDVFYGQKSVSRQGDTGTNGYNGLTNTRDAGGNGNHFQFHGRIMVWSAGPDRQIDPTAPVNQGKNEDNILSWQ